MADLPESGSLTPGTAAHEARVNGLEQENARLRAEVEELRAARQLDGQIRRVADALPVLVSFIDADQRYRYNNKAYEAWLGRPRRELFGRRLDEVLDEAVMATFRPLVESALAGERVSAERSFRDSSGTERHLQVDYVPAQDGEGRVLGFYSLVRDISASKSAEAALRETERRLEAVLDNTRMAVLLMDHRQQCVFANAAAEELTGYSFAEMQGRPLHDVIHHKHPDGSHYPLEDCPIDRAFPEDNQVEGEETFVHKDGSFYPVAFTASPVRDEASRTVGTVIEVRGIAGEKAREAALRESEERFRSMADCAAVPVWVTGRSGIEFVNRAFAEVAGVPADQLTGEVWMQIIHPDDLPPVIEERARAWAEARPYRYEARFRHHNGELRWMHVSCNPRFDREERLIGYVGMAVDFTEQKLAADELRESEARFRAIADSAPAPVWVTNEAGIEFANRGLVDFTGLAADELRGGTWMGLCHPDDVGAVQEARTAAWQTHESYEFEARFRRADGEWRWLHATCEPRESSGAFLGYVGLAVDVTESRRAEEELRAESRILSTLNRVGAALAGELDLERVVQMVTDAGVELTGAQFGAFFYNVLNAAGESYMLYTISGVDRSEFDKFPMPRNTHVFAPTFEGEGVVRSDDITRDPRYGRSAPHHGMPEGHLPVTSYLAVPVASRSGEVIGGLFFGHARPAQFTARHEELLVGIAGQAAVAIDNARLFEAAQCEIAERRRAEDALRELNMSLEGRIEAAIAERERAEEALRQAQKMEAVGQLTGGIAHDFNNLLTVISGNLDLAARRLGSGADPKIARAIASASTGAERAATLTQRLLAFSRRQPLAPKAVDANALLAGMTDLLPRTLGETIEVETRLAGGLGRIEADPHQLESAILNLAVNARDAMPAGGKLVIETSMA
ncbi:MAG TPA: PAS domain S-box protein, partial [Allosphingosinicella sp.]|nr:PAS domain S-box protein [Allosphingosinicella sp.]